MIVISTVNFHTNKQILRTIKNWKEAIEYFKLLGIDTEIHHNESIVNFIKRYLPELNTKYHHVFVHEVPFTGDMWDVAKEARGYAISDKALQNTNDKVSNSEEKLEKSVSNSNQQDNEIQAKIINQLGGQKRLDSLRDLHTLYRDILNSDSTNPIVYHENEDASPKAVVNRIKEHFLSAKNVPDQDIEDLVTHGLSRRNMGGIYLFSPKTIPSKYQGIDTTQGLQLQDIRNTDNLTNLLLAYKETPHSIDSALLKYIVHRIKNVNNYNQDTENNFITHGARDINPSVIKKLHASLLSNPNLISDVLSNQRDQENFIKTNYPQLVKDINGQPHVALSRALNIPNHGEDYSLASYADVKSPPFGNHVFRYFVPMNSMWNHYDLHKSGKLSCFGSEDEVLVDKWHPRIPASEEEVKQLVPRRIFSTNIGDATKTSVFNHAYKNLKNGDHLLKENVLPIIEDYYKHGNNTTEAVSLALKHKDITGDDLLNIAENSKPSDFHRLSWREFIQHPRVTGEHKKKFINNLIDKYNNLSQSKLPSYWSREHKHLTGEFDNIIHTNPKDLSPEHKLSIVNSMLSSGNHIENKPFLLGEDKDEAHKERIKVLKSFANFAPNAEKTLRQAGTSKQEVENMGVEE